MIDLSKLVVREYIDKYGQTIQEMDKDLYFTYCGTYCETNPKFVVDPNRKEIK